MEYVIRITRDPDADVWIAEGENFPGLVLESGSFDALVERLRFAVPELIDLNDKSHETINLFMKSEYRAQVAL